VDPEAYVLGPRARRAVPLIAAALTVIVVGGLLYLRSNGPAPANYAGPSRLSQIAGRYWPDFYFATPSLGWAAIAQMDGDRVWVFRTTDGSAHWQMQFVTSERVPRTPMIRFFDLVHGYLYTGRLYRTSDGGATWETLSLPDATEDFALASPARGWAVDNGVTPRLLYATADGGLTWHVVGKAPAPLYGKGFGGYDFRPTGEGWAGGQAGTPTVYATFDGGASWRSIALPPPPRPIPAPVGKGHPSEPTYLTAVLLPPGSGVVVHELEDFGGEGFFVTHDRGATWNPVSAPPTPATFADITFIDSQHWWASRFGILFKSSDAGRTWHPVATVIDIPGDWTAGSVHGIDARNAWLVLTAQISPAVRSPARTLLMTTDGGVHWAPVNVPQPG
jgi:photosystem II stability/assembly factor-like uncharacterized protein